MSEPFNNITHIPKPPKATGISRRLLLTMTILIGVVIILFLVFLHHYTPRQSLSTSATTLTGLNDNDDTEALIDKIEREKHRVALVESGKNSKQSKYHVNKTTPSEIKISLSPNEFKAASDAPISAYHHTGTPIIDSASNSLSSSSLSPSSSYRFSKTPSSNNHYDSQNLQKEKTAFINTSSQDNDIIPSTLTALHSSYTLSAGTLIPATLITGINSDLPGSMIAKVRRDVYDTPTGNYLLIPQGTTLVGTYDSQVAYGQSRVLIVWSRLIFPNGTSFNLQGMPGADLMGMAGLHDQVDNHYFRIFGSALLFSLFGAAGQLSQPKNNSNQLTAQQIIYGAIGQQMGQTAMQLVAKNMNIQPTLRIRPGASFTVLLTRDMVLPHAYQF